MTARRHLVLTALAAATALALPMGSALAQNYPSRTISLIVSKRSPLRVIRLHTRTTDAVVANRPKSLRKTVALM